MTFALLPRPVRISTGLNAAGLATLLEQLDTESADCLATVVYTNLWADGRVPLIDGVSPCCGLSGRLVGNMQDVHAATCAQSGPQGGDH